ncbi:hypothetical protein XI09_41010 [Bradyrhizobium sp. CCBAU 11386]|uniref:hypothetical protein n=1 Tax=Bradyrhizobium sp. CCBAU 11386 TaxID=1630837 RepID=UPI002304B34E|nr:hypothetical protein [Bradyrhizobium sp. CCBAU 11386]MDA9510931.1 hypothetical protein [Bradyrhizobium sp. CCBAU 11386]
MNMNAAQARGEIRTRADNQLLPKQKKPGAADVGLSDKEIHEARQIRDAEERDPGVVRRLSTRGEAGKQPPKGDVNCRRLNAV